MIRTRNPERHWWPWSRRGELSPERAIRVPLVNSPRYALVDAADHPRIAVYDWWLKSVWSGARWYDYAIAYLPGGEYVLLSRLVARPSCDRNVFHRNRNGLDNRRGNLHVATDDERASATLAPRVKRNLQ